MYEEEIFSIDTSVIERYRLLLCILEWFYMIVRSSSRESYVKIGDKS